MTVSGFTFIRNGIQYDYPFIESIRSLLPLTDELVIAVGNSADGTKDAIDRLQSSKIRVIDTIWDENLRSDGRILAQQTDLALREISGDWGIYLQGDEVLHEDDADIIRHALDEADKDAAIQGLLFDYLHFYGSYSTIGNSRKWYRREVRAIRNELGIRSWGDAQGFRRNGKKLRVMHIPARIYHYGWVKPPEKQEKKLRSFHRLWHSDEWVEKHMAKDAEYRYADGGRLSSFSGTHPGVMHERIASAHWNFDPSISNANVPLRERFLNGIEDATGWRIGEYRNYAMERRFRSRR